MFSLSRKAENVLPTTLHGLNINADFRTVLRCLKVVEDTETTEQDKEYLICKWFFCGVRVPYAQSLFSQFITEDKGEQEQTADKPIFDFDFDSVAIYSSFYQQYRIDLLTVAFLHWRAFMALFSGLGEDTAFRRLISLRTLDTSKLEGNALAEALKAKQAVALPWKHNEKEVELYNDLERRLSTGEDISDLIKQLGG